MSCVVTPFFTVPINLPLLRLCTYPSSGAYTHARHSQLELCRALSMWSSEAVRRSTQSHAPACKRPVHSSCPTCSARVTATIRLVAHVRVQVRTADSSAAVVMVGVGTTVLFIRALVTVVHPQKLSAPFRTQLALNSWAHAQMVIASVYKASLAWTAGSQSLLVCETVPCWCATATCTCWTATYHWPWLLDAARPCILTVTDRTVEA